MANRPYIKNIYQYGTHLCLENNESFRDSLFKLYGGVVITSSILKAVLLAETINYSMSIFLIS